MPLSILDRARRAYLLVLCERSSNPVFRDYLADKVRYLYRAQSVMEIKAILDLPGQRAFDRIMSEPL